MTIAVDATRTDNPGGPERDVIIEPLATTTAAALERARVELNIGAGKAPIRITTVYLQNARPGMVLEYPDIISGIPTRAIIMTVEHEAIAGGSRTHLVAERLAE